MSNAIAGPSSVLVITCALYEVTHEGRGRDHAEGQVMSQVVREISSNGTRVESDRKSLAYFECNTAAFF